MFDLTLTFDNGPEPDVTPHVLDILKAHDIKSTFFVIGEKLADPARRRLAVRAHHEGHWIGNHTFKHTVPLALSRCGRERDRPDPDRDRRARPPLALVSPVRRRRQSRRQAVEAFGGRPSRPQQAELRAVERHPARLG